MRKKMNMFIEVKKVAGDRNKCFDCDREGRNSIKSCDFPNCPLFPYRFGKRPQKALEPLGLKSARLALKSAKEAIVVVDTTPQNAGDKIVEVEGRAKSGMEDVARHQELQLLEATKKKLEAK